jgi:peptide/nickel transport system permease protein
MVLPGCRFAPRCTRRIDLCETAPAALVDVAPGRSSRCLRWAEL